MSDHYLNVTISPSDWPVDLVITCKAAPGAPCHQVPDCPVCEGEGCTECHKHGKKLVDFCNPLAWIEGSEGPKYTFIGEPETPLQSGPVRFVWCGDDYGWVYDTEASDE